MDDRGGWLGRRAVGLRQVSRRERSEAEPGGVRDPSVPALSHALTARARRFVDCSRRVSFEDGFAFEDVGDIGDLGSSAITNRCPDVLKQDDHGCFELRSWEDYYKLRGLPPTSLAALLLTFPLTIYHGLMKFCAAQLMIAASSRSRRLRIHVVGVEKELAFLDMFDELFRLVSPSGIKLDLVFVVRGDMMPPECKDMEIGGRTGGHTMRVVSGTYNDSLSPEFDCGGRPDVVFALNAGLFAYDSWSFVTDYIEETGVTAVFTDYNEYAGNAICGRPLAGCANKYVFGPPRKTICVRNGSRALAQRSARAAICGRSGSRGRQPPPRPALAAPQLNFRSQVLGAQQRQLGRGGRQGLALRQPIPATASAPSLLHGVAPVQQRVLLLLQRGGDGITAR